VSSRSRYLARARRLTPEQESTIRGLARRKSLRSLAVDFGVSHETIRAVLRRGFVLQAPASYLGRPAPMNAMARRDTVVSDADQSLRIRSAVGPGVARGGKCIFSIDGISIDGLVRRLVSH
jgi:hypothetical protein